MLVKLLQLVNTPEPDLAVLFAEEIQAAQAQIKGVAKAQQVSFRYDTVTGTGLFTLKFSKGFSVVIPGVSILVDANVEMTLSRTGFSGIKGIKVDGPGPLDPGISSVTLKGQELEVKVGPITRSFPLPKF